MLHLGFFLFYSYFSLMPVVTSGISQFWEWTICFFKHRTPHLGLHSLLKSRSTGNEYSASILLFVPSDFSWNHWVNVSWGCDNLLPTPNISDFLSSFLSLSFSFPSFLSFLLFSVLPLIPLGYVASIILLLKFY